MDIPEKDLEYQEIFKKSSKLPSSIPEGLRNPPTMEDLLNHE